MDTEKVKADIQNAVGDVPLKTVRNSVLIENPQDLLKIARFLKEDAAYRLDYLSSLTASDFLEYLETIYHLYSVEKKTGPVTLRVRVPRASPIIPSLVSIYRGAEFQERDNSDLFGIVYDGHPDPRRIMMWEGFEGFPMRKDYVQEDSETLEMQDVEWLENHGISVSEAVKLKAEELKKLGQRAVAKIVKPEIA